MESMATLASIDSSMVEYDGYSTTAEDAVDLAWLEYSREAAAAAAEDSEHGGVAATDDAELTGDCADNRPNLAAAEDTAVLDWLEYSRDAAAAAAEDADHSWEEYSGGVATIDGAEHINVSNIAAIDDARIEDSVDSLLKLAAAEDPIVLGLSEHSGHYHGFQENNGDSVAVYLVEVLQNLSEVTAPDHADHGWQENKGDSPASDDNWQTVTYTKRRSNKTNDHNKGNASDSVSHATISTVAVSDNAFSSLVGQTNDNGKAKESKKRRKRKKTKKPKVTTVVEEVEEEPVKMEVADMAATLSRSPEACTKQSEMHSRRFAKSCLGYGGILIIILVVSWQWLLYYCRALLGVSRF